MTALKGQKIEAFVKARDKAIPLVLIYGPDLGLVRERADTLARQVTADFKDPFNYVEFADADLKADPTKLADEATALSFAGGERVVRLRTVGEASSKAIKLLLDGIEAQHLKPNALTIIEAGDLSKRSGVRKMFEAAKFAIALPSYVDNEQSVKALAQEIAASEGLQFDKDALALAASLLGEDRGVSRSELEKLVLFVGPAKTRAENNDTKDTILVEDVRAVLIDTVSDAFDAIGGAAADGASMRLATILHKSSSAGASPIGALIGLQRQFMRLRTAQALVANGASPSDAMKKLRPPVFFMEQRPFEARLRKWPLKRIDKALELLLEAEMAAKTTGAPQQEIIERTSLRIAAMAGR